ncbi:MAG: PepSY domain-containing protein [Gammaproteobacteria bacterium]|nr:PepSY domain-containing protein [Gammaproteobacteria bacterium]
MNRPPRRKLRRVFVQAHLWLALALGLYIVVISLSGSAVVFRSEITRWAVPFEVPSTDGERLTGEALMQALGEVYADHRVLRFNESPRPSRPVAVLLERDGAEHGRLFDPYARADMGESYPVTVRVVEWLVALHDDLLAGDTGRRVNGIAGALVLILVLTGAVIWWPGPHRWKQSLYATPSKPRFAWHLHSAVGFWALLLLANWALTGVYMAFPAPFEGLIDWLDANPDDFERPGEGLLRLLTTAHFGRFGGLEVRIAWAVLGLAPVLLFCTGVLLWYRRVLRPRRRRRSALI